MTTYLDKHGTEIREGDRVRENGIEWTLTDDPDGYVWSGYDVTVLSRADGSPVYRYADGQDVREGDIFQRPTGTVDNARASWLRIDRGDDVKVISATWAACTLIRRATADTDEPRDTQIKTQNDILATCIRLGALQADSSVMGAGWIRVVVHADDATTARIREHFASWLPVALQVDVVQKQIATAAYRNGVGDYIIPILGPAPQLQPLPMPGHTIRMDRPIPDCGDALVALLRALNQPTLEQRFAAFKKRLHAVSQLSRVTVRFDCDQARGPSALLWCDALPLWKPRLVREHDDLEFLEMWANEIGWLEMGKR